MFTWVNPFLSVGFSRPLQKDGELYIFLSRTWTRIHGRVDLWHLPDKHLTDRLTHQVEKNFYARCRPEDRPRIPSVTDENATDVNGPATEVITDVNMEKKAEVKDDTEKAIDPASGPEPIANDDASAKQYDSSLIKALHTTFFWRWWAGGALNLFSGSKHPASVMNFLTCLLSRHSEDNHTAGQQSLADVADKLICLLPLF